MKALCFSKMDEPYSGYSFSIKQREQVVCEIRLCNDWLAMEFMDVISIQSRTRDQ